MANRVLSPEQMQELKGLGIDTSKAYFAYDSTGYLTDRITASKGGEVTPAFTLQDILEMLPENITTDHGVFKQITFSLQIHYGLLEYSTPKLGLHTEIVSKKETYSLLQAAFKMLKWCKLHNYI